MDVIRARNVNDALMMASTAMRDNPHSWRSINPRDNGATMEYERPVATVYARPFERVLFCPKRDANPFFHLMEGLWMLAGRNDAEWIGQFTSRISQYAEHDGKFHGAYGYRWRAAFDFDQLSALVLLLAAEPDTRRAVLSMWSPQDDLGCSAKDIPCNTHVYFKIREGSLNMTVCCRSNDIILGCYGANAVHFSMLQEYVARKLNVKVGTYTHVSDSWHYYTDNPFAQRIMAEEIMWFPNYYSPTHRRIQAMSLINVEDTLLWDYDLAAFFTDSWDDESVYSDLFFRGVAVPARRAYEAYKNGDLEAALRAVDKVVAPDWRIDMTRWLTKRAFGKTRDESKELAKKEAQGE